MADYQGQYSGQEVDRRLGLAGTALQQHQSLAEYRKASAQDEIDAAKANKVTDATADNLAGFDANGNLKDSGIASGEVAKIDGYYEGMGVGVADNLTGRGDAVPAMFTRRTTGGTASVADGVATFKDIKGNTIVWNQLVKVSSQSSGTKGGITCTRNSDNSITLNGTATDTTGFNFTPFGTRLIPSSHVALIACIPVSGTFSAAGNNAMFSDGYPGSGYALPLSGGKKIVTARSSSTLNTPFYDLKYISVGDTFDNYTLKFELFDLTQMFGAGKEPSTVAEFEALFPAAYYAYNAGQLLSLKMTGIGTDGFNQFDGTKAKVFGDKAYYINGTYTTLKFAKTIDGEQTDITPSDHLYTPTEDGYIFATGVSADFCINLSHSGVRNGEYEEHWSQTRNIDVTTIKGKVNGQGESVVIFPEGMKAAGTAYDEIHGNKAIKRIGVVDLGSLTWGYSAEYNRFSANIAGHKVGLGNIVCAKYATNATEGITTINKTISSTSSYEAIYVIDSNYTSAADFKAAMSGVMLYYELATPVEYIIDDADVPNYNYRVSDWGTETLLPEGVDASGNLATAPIAADIIYGMNAVDTLRNIPTLYESKEHLNTIMQSGTSAYNKLVNEAGLSSLFAGIFLGVSVDGLTHEITANDGTPIDYAFLEGGTAIAFVGQEGILNISALTGDYVVTSAPLLGSDDKLFVKVWVFSAVEGMTYTEKIISA